MREIKFRAWNKKEKKWTKEFLINRLGYPIVNMKSEILGKELPEIREDLIELLQYTGLKDKNDLTEIFEGDIIDTEGKVIGNYYENKDLLKDQTNLLIQGFGTKNWCETYKKAMERGCQNAQ